MPRPKHDLTKLLAKGLAVELAALGALSVFAFGALVALGAERPGRELAALAAPALALLAAAYGGGALLWRLRRRR
ncbi:hypothetical protein ACFODL_20885 [Phenylobacterium terrae]|uniref:Uncharacterized protein n=1 Tax=Phenylobacterium terrae TaxID=2665495 RepID=A0ABW4MZW8_9CAUL